MQYLSKQMQTECEQKKSKFKSICVFYGSTKGYKSIYGDVAIELGRELFAEVLIWCMVVA